MAGVKITDLGALGSAASDDLLYIVDVSDFSESPQGTSKKIEVQNIASAFGLESGSYTPTISGELNLTAAPNAATYIRVGNVATVSIQLEILFSAAENSGLFEVELPVPSNFTTVKQCFGLLQYSYAGTESELVALTIAANTTNNTCQVGIEVVTDELTMSYVTLQFQYEII
jgi:hypothetical protein